MTNPFAAPTTTTTPATTSNPFASTAPTTAPVQGQSVPVPQQPVQTYTDPTRPGATTPDPTGYGATPPDPWTGGGDPFGDPAPQEARAPRFRELYGRLLLLVPKKLEAGIVSSRFKNPDGSAQTQDRMTADIIVLDGGTIHYGGEPEKIPSVPHTKTAEPPARWDNAYISFTGIISQCREALVKRGMVLGRLSKGADDSKGNPPWLLQPATDADKVLARQWLAAQPPPADPFG